MPILKYLKCGEATIFVKDRAPLEEGRKVLAACSVEIGGREVFATSSYIAPKGSGKEIAKDLLQFLLSLTEAQKELMQLTFNTTELAEAVAIYTSGPDVGQLAIEEVH